MGLQRKPLGDGARHLERKSRKEEPAFREQERRLADAIPGGKLTPGSGNSRRPSRKGDAVGDYFLGEGKTTANVASITIHRADLWKIEEEARTTRKIPCLTFGFDRFRHTGTSSSMTAEEATADAMGVREDWIAFPIDKAKRIMAIVNAVIDGNLEAAQAMGTMVKP